MPNHHTILIGKAIKKLAQLRGGGSALPGLFVEKIDPTFVGNALAPLPKGVVIVSGTNGKTTTTKMVVELLEGQGLKVFTNRTGSNFVRGVAAALLGEVDKRGKLNADIAVLELDEAHAVHFVRTVKPTYSLLLNVMRDQLDRFGEIDTTARMLETVASETSKLVVLNREDNRVARIADKLKDKEVIYYGLSDKTRAMFPSDDDMRSGKTTKSSSLKAVGLLESIDGEMASFKLVNEKLDVKTKLRGIYNIYNAAAAMTLVKSIMGDKLDITQLKKSLANIEPAFGRGETIKIGNRTCELVLVKNPAGFRLGLSSFSAQNYSTMIAVNDNYADGRDMSWLWDVDFDSLSETGVLMVTGVRAYDMALRLQYDEVEIKNVEPSLPKALKEFISTSGTGPMRIYCTYTCMLALRKELAKITTVKAAIS